MRILISGGSGVLGRVLIPLLGDAGHGVIAPRHAELDLFDSTAVRSAFSDVSAVFHLATRIPPASAMAASNAWDENDRLRSEATHILIDAALDAGAQTFVYPSVTFVYPSVTFVYPPDGNADEDTPLEQSANLSSTLQAESEVARFASAGRRGVTLRFGLLWGPGTGLDAPAGRYGTTLHVSDAGAALLAALDVPAGLYNVVADRERISNARFKAATGWRPTH